MRRPKSSFGLNLKKKNTDALKFPKEFLVEFWEILENERGDPTWKTATGTFLRLSKKGTKTPSGLNLREIPTLLDCEMIPTAKADRFSLHPGHSPKYTCSYPSNPPRSALVELLAAMYLLLTPGSSTIGERPGPPLSTSSRVTDLHDSAFP